ncbi:FdhF/YdeP family oxidoreductase [Armatimonas sp.]|uniref:FdhF/YdeP family oxidoreductase n=1 Tax=Armatimonas sp. TaxID=1872638 RepID=UPI00286C471F|nr:FdhF/YdeP family oxidoreductase [Armatimonas sp.]
MSEEKKREKAAAQPPIETDVTLGERKRFAGGKNAVLKSAEAMAREQGWVRGVKTWLAVNQKTGFDCPSCAWPDPTDHRSRFEFCENGAKAIASEATSKRIGRAFFAEHSVQSLAQNSDLWLDRQGRLIEPLVLRLGSDHYEPIAWEAAFALIGEHLKALASPDEAIFYTSGRASNEAAFLYQLFVRRFGTNNLPDCSNMCHESSGVGLGESLGFGKSTVTLEELENADVIFVFGQNPGTNHPRMLTSLQKAVRRGAKLVSVNPLPEAGLTAFAHPQEPLGMLDQATPLACQHLPVRINGDVALLKGLCKAVLEAGAQDDAFITAHTAGYEVFRADLEATNWQEITDACGVSEAELRRAGELASRAKRLVLCWAMGLTQHKNGVANVQYLVNLILLRGMLGKDGGGLMCVRGHSNVQGDRTMGIYEKMPDAWLDRLGAVFGFEPPRKHGFDTVEAIQAMLAGKARVFFALGGNFLSATPDTELTAEALRQCALTVQVSTKLNRSHLVTGETALILPCLGRTERDLQSGGEQFVTVEDSVCNVHASRGSLEPASPYLKSEPAIVVGVAQVVLGEDWSGFTSDYDRIRDKIAAVVPGFEDVNARVRVPGGFVLPNPPRERVFPTPDGKAHFTVHPLPRWHLADGEWLMMTIRTHDQFNTTIYGNDDRYRGIYGGRRVVLLHEADMAEAGLTQGQLVDIVSVFEGEERLAEKFVAVPYSLPRRCCATYFPEANVLIPLRSYADKSKTPTSKSVIVRLEPAPTAA